MAVELVMPRLSESMEEGTIVAWLVADGTQVDPGDEIAEIETDKSTLPYVAPEAGVLRILVPAGATLELGETIGLIDDLVGLGGELSIGPPGVGADGETDGPIPAPRGPEDEPATASHEFVEGWHEPHTVHASAPPPSGGRSGAWGAGPPASPLGSPGPEPADDDEGETTEFTALLEGEDDGASAGDGAAAAATVPAQPETADLATDVAQPAVDAPWVDAASAASAGEGARFAAHDLIGPGTLPPRPPEPAETAPAGARVKASPVARRLARELGIDLGQLPGSGPEGRVVRADIEAAQAGGAARPPRPAAGTRPRASEHTPPVDDARAAAPIPPVDPPAPDPEPEPEGTPAPVLDTPPDGAPAPAARTGSATESPVDPPPQAGVVPESEPAGQAGSEAATEPTSDAVPAARPDEPAPEAQAEPEPDVRPEPDTNAEPAPERDTNTEPELEPTAQPQPRAASTADPQPATEPAATPERAGGGKGEPEITELSRQGQTVARRMAESKATIPSFHADAVVDAEPLLALRAELASTRPDVDAPSVNDLLVKAAAVALRSVPALNGAYRDGRVETYPRINVGIAVDAGGALLVPVVHDADRLPLGEIAARTSRLVAAARDGGLRPADVASATFTVSNLGAHGVARFTAVITPGQAGILTAGAISARPVVREDAVVVGQSLVLTLTADHRAIYGAAAATYLGRLRDLLERPSSLLV